MNLKNALHGALLCSISAVTLASTTVETAILAAMKLAEAPNYSWVSTISDDARTYDIEGKTQLGGYTWQQQPMPKTIARRLGREGGHELEAIFLGPLDYVMRTPGGWKTLRELPKRHDAWADDQWYYVPVPVMGRPDMPADVNDLTAFNLPPAILIPVLRVQEREQTYSNAQFALARPHDELAIIVSSHDEFQLEGDIATGSLTDLGARLLLVHDGHEYITPIIADGRFKLWISDGLVTRYMVELAGILVVDKKPVYVRQKSITVVKEVGTTHFAVPREASARLRL